MLVQVRIAPKHRSTHVSNYQRTERESYERDENQLDDNSCVLGSAFLYIRVCPGLSFATKRSGPSCCTLFTCITCFSLQITLSQNYLLPIISVLAENTLLKTAYHFLLLLVGFDTLTYRKTTIDPLHLWVINTLFWRRCQGVKRLWQVEIGKEKFIQCAEIYCHFLRESWTKGSSGVRPVIYGPD